MRKELPWDTAPARGHGRVGPQACASVDVEQARRDASQSPADAPRRVSAPRGYFPDNARRANDGGPAWCDESSSRAATRSPRHLHLHAHVDQRRWTREFSRYDAGWLHFFASGNDGDIARADWDDLNIPARAATLAAAGLPMIQRADDGARVATRSLARRLGVGVFARDMADLAAQLRDTARTQAIREQVWRVRDEFTFDRHADDLLAFLGEVARTRERASA